MTVGQGISIAGLAFPFFRLLITIGLMRCLIRGEIAQLKLNAIDRMMAMLGMWIFFAGFFHTNQDGSGPIYAGGIVLNIVGIYVLIRCWISDFADIKRLIATLAVLLAPIAIEMASELLTKRNLFGLFGYVSSDVMVRDGKLRAQGPFPHPILAGTVGATCIPLMFAIWREHRVKALLGLAACITMVLTSNSSGPVVSAVAGVFAILVWYQRRRLRFLRWAGILIYIALELVMSRPAYYFVTYINVTGSSTGHHRARLIESAIDHLDEWWLFGTDYTRHWMASGVTFSADHTDITNYFLAFGINGGLPALFIVILLLWKAYIRVGQRISSYHEHGDNCAAFSCWCLGATLFSHTVTSFSIAYFGQSVFFFWMSVSLIATLQNPAEESLDSERVKNPHIRTSPSAGFG
jgi:hypothetical protein